MSASTIIPPATTRRLLWRAGALLLLGVWAGPRLGWAQVDEQTVEVEHAVAAAPDKLVQEVEDEAVQGALAKAVQEVAGVAVQSEAQLVQSEGADGLAQSFVRAIRASAYGRVIGYELVDSNWHTGAFGEQIYWVRLRATVRREEGRPDPSFTVALDLGATHYRAAADPAASDEIVLEVTPSQDAYLTLFNVTADTVQVLLPNPYIRANRVPGGQTYTFPPADWRARGLRLRAALPPGRTRLRESMIAVVTREPVPFQPMPDRTVRSDGATVNTVVASLDALQRWLVGIPLDARAVAQASYVVEQ